MVYSTDLEVFNILKDLIMEVRKVNDHLVTLLRQINDTNIVLRQIREEIK